MSELLLFTFSVFFRISSFEIRISRRSSWFRLRRVGYLARFMPSALSSSLVMLSRSLSSGSGPRPGALGTRGAAVDSTPGDEIIELPKFIVTDSRILPCPKRGAMRRSPVSKSSRMRPPGDRAFRARFPDAARGRQRDLARRRLATRVPPRSCFARAAIPSTLFSRATASANRCR